MKKLYLFLKYCLFLSKFFFHELILNSVWIFKEVLLVKGEFQDRAVNYLIFFLDIGEEVIACERSHKALTNYHNNVNYRISKILD